MALVLGANIAVVGPGFVPRDVVIAGVIGGDPAQIDIELLRGEACRIVIEVTGDEVDLSSATGAALIVSERFGATPVLDWRLGAVEAPLVYSAPNRLVAELPTELSASVPAGIYKAETFVAWASGTQFAASGRWRHANTLTKGL